MIYLLTVFSLDGRHKRVWGYYLTLEEAQYALTHDIGGMSECLYEWLVIESVLPGISPTAEVLQWARLDTASQYWLRRNAGPSWASDLCNLGIG